MLFVAHHQHKTIWTVDFVDLNGWETYPLIINTFYMIIKPNNTSNESYEDDFVD